MEPVAPARVDELLAAVADVRAVVVGDLMLDRYVSGVVDRVSPEAPVPVVLVEDESAAIGGASNVAANVTALGAACRVVGCAGRDAAGQTLGAELERLGVATDGIVFTDTRPTTVKTRVLAKRQQIVRFDHEVDADVDEGLASALALAVTECAGEADVLIMADYDKGVLVPVVLSAVMAAAKTRGAPTIADPKRRHFFEYEHVTVLKPNAKALEDALGELIHPDDAGWMEATRRRLGCDHLLLTLGERGVALQSQERGLVRVPAAARAVYDVSGAGDTVTAVLALVLAAGGSPAEAAVLANHAAAVEVGKAGVATVSRAEITEHFLAQRHTA